MDTREVLNTFSRGDGHPVMLIPPFSNDERVLLLLRCFLKLLGYTIVPWNHGVNTGCKNQLAEKIATDVKAATDQFGQRISIVGWSLGAVYGWKVAHELPDHIHRVITLAGPLKGNLGVKDPQVLLEVLESSDRDTFRSWVFEIRKKGSPPVPCTCIYSMSDKTIECFAAMGDERTHSVEVEHCSHQMFGFHPSVLHEVVKALPA